MVQKVSFPEINSIRIKCAAPFDNIGVVFSSKIGNQTSLRYVNFGFNYKRAKSFNRNMEMGGNIGAYSQSFQMAAQADANR